jgi:hypothetical protein
MLCGAMPCNAINQYDAVKCWVEFGSGDLCSVDALLVQIKQCNEGATGGEQNRQTDTQRE